jgi:hypothetical protein
VAEAGSQDDTKMKVSGLDQQNEEGFQTMMMIKWMMNECQRSFMLTALPARPVSMLVLRINFGGGGDLVW